MPRPIAHDIHIPCPSCRLLDYYITYNEAKGVTAVVCQHCKAEFIRIQYVPETPPDPAVVI